MSDENPTLQDLWRLLGAMNKRFDTMNERFDSLEREMVAFKVDVTSRISALDASVTSRIGALKESIEARDFRLDEHGRRLTKLEDSRL